MTDDPKESVPGAEESADTQRAVNATLAQAQETPAHIEDTENYIEAYHAVAEWIRFADAKAGVVLTIAGALAGLLIPTIEPILRNESEAHLFPMWKPVCLALFALFTFFLLLSGIAAFRCIRPFRNRGLHPSLDDCQHFHPAAIANAYKLDEVQKFVQDCDRAGVGGFRAEVIAALLFDSHISNVKYQRVTLSIQLFSASALFAFLYLLIKQL